MAKGRITAEKRKKLILDSSLQLFSNSNYGAIVMEDIAKASNIARTTLYDYYSSKEDILIALVERASLDAREIKNRGNTCKEHLEFLAEDLIDIIQKNKVIYRILFEATPVMSEKLSSKFIRWREQNFEQVFTIAEMMKNAGEIREGVNTDDVTFAFRAYIGQRTGDLIMKHEDVDPRVEAKRLCDLLWYGIGRKG